MYDMIRTVKATVAAAEIVENLVVGFPDVSAHTETPITRLNISPSIHNIITNKAPPALKSLNFATNEQKGAICSWELLEIIFENGYSTSGKIPCLLKCREEELDMLEIFSDIYSSIMFCKP